MQSCFQIHVAVRRFSQAFSYILSHIFQLQTCFATQLTNIKDAFVATREGQIFPICPIGHTQMYATITIK